MEADGSLKEQTEAETRKGGSRRKLEGTEGSGNPQGWKRTEVAESRRDLKPARVEKNGSCGGQKGFETRKGGEERKLRRAEEIRNSQEWRKTEVQEDRRR